MNLLRTFNKWFTEYGIKAMSTPMLERAFDNLYIALSLVTDELDRRSDEKKPAKPSTWEMHLGDVVSGAACGAKAGLVSRKWDEVTCEECTLLTGRMK